MNISEDRIRTIFKNERDGKTYYSLGLSKKDKEGNYINGYISCRFPKSATIENKTKIKIYEGWVDFYIKDKITHPYIFINKYEIIEGKEEQPEQTIQAEIPMNYKTEYKTKDDSVVIDDSDLPF